MDSIQKTESGDDIYTTLFLYRLNNGHKCDIGCIIGSAAKIIVNFVCFTLHEICKLFRFHSKLLPATKLFSRWKMWQKWQQGCFYQPQHYFLHIAETLYNLFS